MEFRKLLISLIVLGCATLLKGQGFKPAGQISQDCFDCLCQASSECNEDVGCVSEGPGLYYCGPYTISYAYWKDSGSPGENPDDPLDFEKCLNYKPCAEAAIRGYMNKYAMDCDGNQYIDCYDYARIHKAGPASCNSTWIFNTNYWTMFKSCSKDKGEF